jgi:hypothetical protein
MKNISVGKCDAYCAPRPHLSAEEVQPARDQIGSPSPLAERAARVHTLSRFGDTLVAHWAVITRAQEPKFQFLRPGGGIKGNRDIVVAAGFDHQFSLLDETFHGLAGFASRLFAKLVEYLIEAADVDFGLSEVRGKRVREMRNRVPKAPGLLPSRCRSTHL